MNNTHLVKCKQKYPLRTPLAVVTGIKKSLLEKSV